MNEAAALADRFQQVFGHSPETIWSAPGRVNVIGEHTDYNEGFVLPFALEQRVYAAASHRVDGWVVARSVQVPSEVAAVEAHSLRPDARPDGWLAYPLGVVWALRTLGATGGLDLLVDGNVPLGAGLSSSAALECAVGCAIADLAGVQLSRVDLALACQKAEREFVGVPCGPMDQLAALLCTAGHVLFIDTRDLDRRQVPLDPASSGHTVLLIDTKVRHTLASSAYADRRRSCERAAKRLGVRALRDLHVADLEVATGELHDLSLARRVKHVVTENARVCAAVHVLEEGLLEDLGPLLTGSHISLRDDYEVSCLELDLAADAAERGGALGARMIGGGFGGSVLVLADTTAEASIRSSIVTAFAERDLREPDISCATPSAGASEHVIATTVSHS